MGRDKGLEALQENTGDFLERPVLDSYDCRAAPLIGRQEGGEVLVRENNKDRKATFPHPAGQRVDSRATGTFEQILIAGRRAPDTEGHVEPLFGRMIVLDLETTLVARIE